MSTLQSGVFDCIPTWEIKRRIETIPLPKKLKSSFLKTVMSWADHSGIEWTVGRLKSFQDCLRQSWGSGQNLTCKPEWFATTPTGNFKGMWNTLFRVAMSSSENLKAVLVLCDIRTIWTFKSLSLKMESELLQDVQASPVCEGKKYPHSHLLRRIHGALNSLGWYGYCHVTKPVPILQVPPDKLSHVVKLPSWSWQLGSGELLRKWYLQLTYAFGARFRTTGLSLPDLVGEINATMEPGLKTRYFAFPNGIIQRALEPLKDSLLSFVKKIPWDCTFDQRKADSTITRHLRQRKMVYSVDLSKATDHFPWVFQRRILEMITSNHHLARNQVELFNDVVERGLWETPNGNLVRWTKGQPLGLGPSFPVFTLSHGLLLYALNKCRWDEAFYVLGDDVVIFDETLHTKYRKVLSDWGVSVSPSKSLSSNSIAQFSGMTFTSKSGFWCPKWRRMTKDTILDLQAYWYVGLTKGLPDEDLINQILELPEPWGSGRNPLGKSLEERFPPSVVRLLVDREHRRKLTALPRGLFADIRRITLAFKKAGFPFEYNKYVYDNWKIISHGPNPVDRPNRTAWDASVLRLCDDTEMPGYPALRFRSQRVDPWSKGNLKSWRQLFRKARFVGFPTK